ncbi:MAG: carbohydrate ABC transporter permease [Spirochaetaceae bacterium]
MSGTGKVPAVRARDISIEDFNKWMARRRWARAGIIYTVMLAFAIVFLGPLLFAALSSLKTNPLEYPPSLAVPQLSPRNWVNAARLGRLAGGGPLLGGFAPGAEVPFEITYFAPEGGEPEAPEVVVPRRRPGAGLGAVMQIEYAADYAAVSPVQEIDRRDGRHVIEIREEGKTLRQEVPGTFVTYRFTISYVGDGPEVDRLPLDVTSEAPQFYVSSTITAHRLERRGRVASFDNVAPGFIGYMLHNYVRVFREARSVSTGNSLFFSWTLNSGIYAVARIITNLAFAAMAGYALARFTFPGKTVIFMLVLFSQMVPAQVTFISNYLVIRDGIFGLTKLFGVDSLLNTMAGVIIGGAGASAMIEASKVFIMKQFFESIPRQVEEAAMIDGATQWQRYYRVVLPMARPALGAVTILTFQGAWNDFFWPFIVLTSPEDIKTLPIGLLSFRQTYGAAGDWGLILSGAVLSAIPIVVIFVVFQRYFLEGVSFGGSKE